MTDVSTMSVDGNTYTQTRVLDAAFLAQGTLQAAAGCVEGDTEVSTTVLQ